MTDEDELHAERAMEYDGGDGQRTCSLARVAETLSSLPKQPARAILTMRVLKIPQNKSKHDLREENGGH